MGEAARGMGWAYCTAETDSKTGGSVMSPFYPSYILAQLGETSLTTGGVYIPHPNDLQHHSSYISISSE